MQNNKISKNNKGFTLLEIIVTVVILALVTAPFLSSFITASDTNVKSKRIQEANELSQYIIERCKASNVSGVTSELGLKRSATNEEYKGKISDSNLNLPAGFSKNYEAEIVLKPSDKDINKDGIPEIESLNRKHCCVLSDVLYRYDASATASNYEKRKVKVTIDDKGTEYSVKLEISYDDHTSTNQITWRYKKEDIDIDIDGDGVDDNPLTVYMLWSSFADFDSGGDELYIMNNTDTNVHVYIIDQKIQNKKLLNANNVIFEEKTGNKNSMSGLYSGSSVLNNTIVFTNVASLVDGNNTNKNEIIQLNNVNSLYDVNVVIRYLNKEISKYEATKIEMLN